MASKIEEEAVSEVEVIDSKVEEVLVEEVEGEVWIDLRRWFLISLNLMKIR